MSRCSTMLSLPLSILLAASSAYAAEGITLRYKMEKEKPQYYKTQTTMNQTQNFNGVDIETDVSHQDVSRRTLEKIDENGAFHLRSENKLLQVEMSAGAGGEFKYDSTSETGEEGTVLSSSLNPLYEKLDGAAFNLTMTPRGELLELTGLAELLEDVLKDNPIAQQFSGGAGNKSQQLSMAELFVTFSEKPVKPGDTWEVPYEIELPNLGTAVGKRIYKYEADDTVGDTKTVRISMSHELAFDLDLDSAGAKVKGKMKIDQSSGVIQFDPERGELISMDSTYQLSGDLTVDAAGQLIPVKSTQTQTVKVERLDSPPEE